MFGVQKVQYLKTGDDKSKVECKISERIRGPKVAILGGRTSNDFSFEPTMEFWDPNLAEIGVSTEGWVDVKFACF